MRVIRAPSIARAHELAVKAVLEKGVQVVTENGEATLELDEIGIRIEDPFTEPMVSPASRFSKRFMEQYTRNLLTGSDAVFEYDYHGRLFAWGEGLGHGGGGLEVDQVTYMVERLSASPVSRRAVAITWIPPLDETLSDCPCLQLVQVLIRGGHLHMKVVFRSNDMLSAAGANMFALAHLQKEIADRLSLPCGSYTHISLVPHLYHVRDLSDIPPFCREGASIRPHIYVCKACRKCPGTPPSP